ncbi:hypothetical protein, partial [Alcaligenes aquatilis]|uniref:hypothetical protein n=1 Tax=Alcaligenes aquatilis TaxID=323284 RepID=UPI003D1BCE39
IFIFLYIYFFNVFELIDCSDLYQSDDLGLRSYPYGKTVKIASQIVDAHLHAIPAYWDAGPDSLIES